MFQIESSLAHRPLITGRSRIHTVPSMTDWRGQTFSPVALHFAERNPVLWAFWTCHGRFDGREVER